MAFTLWKWQLRSNLLRRLSQQRRLAYVYIYTRSDMEYFAVTTVEMNLTIVKQGTSRPVNYSLAVFVQLLKIM